VPKADIPLFDTLVGARERTVSSYAQQGESQMAFVQFTQPDDKPVVINTERIVTAVPLPPDAQGTRITFTHRGHQDVRNSSPTCCGG
jgi:hypothetical protein